MTYDMNDAEPQKTGDLIPDGSFAKITMIIRPGGADGQGEVDRGLLRASNSPGSDVLMLDAEFTVVEGVHARRKFWQMFTVSGGKVDENGVSIGWKISKSAFRAMIDSALGLDPEDTSEAAKAKRRLRGLADLGGITFVAKIAVEPSPDPRYGDKNRLDRPVLPNEKEWRLVMDGKEVPPRPSRSRTAGKAPAPSPQPAWHQAQAQSVPAATPAWQHAGAQTTAQTPTQPAAQPAKPAGPAWLNG